MEGREACRHQRGDSSETDFVFVLYRTQLFNPDDIETVKKIQAGYEVQTLSQFLGKPAPAAPPASAPIAAPFPPPAIAPMMVPNSAPPPTYSPVRLLAPIPVRRAES